MKWLGRVVRLLLIVSCGTLLVLSLLIIAATFVVPDWAVEQRWLKQGIRTWQVSAIIFATLAFLLTLIPMALSFLAGLAEGPVWAKVAILLFGLFLPLDLAIISAPPSLIPELKIQRVTYLPNTCVKSTDGYWFEYKNRKNEIDVKQAGDRESYVAFWRWEFQRAAFWVAGLAGPPCLFWSLFRFRLVAKVDEMPA